MFRNAFKTIFALFLMAALCLFGSNSFAAGIQDVDETLTTTAIGAGAGEASDEGDDAGKKGEDKKDENDGADPVDKLDKLLGEIKQIRPDIDAIPAMPAEPVQDGSDEAALEKFARQERHFSFATSFLKASGEFDAGKYEVAFESFKKIYSDFNFNRKALCYMTLCRTKEGKISDAIALGKELLDILKQDAAISDIYADVTKMIDEMNSDSNEAGLGASREVALSKKLNKVLAKINKLYPAIANIPDELNKPKEDNFAGDDNFDKMIREKKSRLLKELQDAHKLFEGRKFEEAYKAFEKRFDERPLSLRALYYMALCKMELDRPDEALKLTSKLAAMVRDRHELKHSRAEIAEELGLKEARDKKGKDGKKDKDGKNAPGGSRG